MQALKLPAVLSNLQATSHGTNILVQHSICSTETLHTSQGPHIGRQPKKETQKEILSTSPLPHWEAVVPTEPFRPGTVSAWYLAGSDATGLTCKLGDGLVVWLPVSLPAE